MLSIGMATVSAQQVYAAAALALDEVVGLKDRGLTAEEVRRSVARILREKRLGAEQVQERAQGLGEAALFGGVRYYWDLPVLYERLTSADVARVAATWLVPDNLRLVILAPKGTPEFSEESKRKFHAVLDRLKDAPPAPPPVFTRTAYSTEEAARPTSGAWGEPAGSAARRTPVRVVLDNGLTVLVQEDRRHGLAAAALVLGVGSGDDPAGREGLASFAAHAVSASHAAAARQTRRAVPEAIPLSPDVAVSRGETEFRILGEPARLQAGLRALAGLLREPRVSPGVIEPLRRSSLEFLDRSDRDPTFVTQELFREKVYAGHPYAHASAGTPAGIRAVSAEDVAGFLARHYRPGQAVLAISGDLEAGAAMALARELFGPWDRGTGGGPGAEPSGGGNTIDGKVPPEAAGSHGRSGTFSRSMVAANSQVIVGSPGPRAGDPDFRLVRLLGTAVTLSAFEDMVFTRRAAFSVTSLPEAFREGGALAITVIAPHLRRDEAVFDLQRSLRRIATEGVAPADLQDLLHIQAGQDAAATAGVLGAASALAWRELEGAAVDPAGVTVESLKGAAERYLRPESLIVVKVGPPAV